MKTNNIIKTIAVGYAGTYGGKHHGIGKVLYKENIKTPIR